MRARVARAVLPLLIAAAAIAAIGTAPVWADDTDSDDQGGVGLVVTVSPAPVKPTSSSTPTISSGTTAGTDGADGGSTVSTLSPTELSTENVGGYSLGGVLYVSGIGTGYTPALDPLGGTLDTWFVVKNLTEEIVDIRAQFGVSNFFGVELDRTDPAAYTLDPGEVRTIRAQLHGVGQWAAVTADYTLTPPHVVDGIALSPLNRDGVVLYPPWFVLLVLGLATLGYVTVRWVRANRVSPVAEAAA